MHRTRPRLLARFLMVSVPALGLLLAMSPAAGASTTPKSAAAQAALVARQALEHLSVGQHAADHRVSRPVTPGQGIVPGTKHKLVRVRRHRQRLQHGHRQLDRARRQCTSTTSLAAFWVGIDGYSSSSVEQDGTLIECYRGAAYYYTWWEMYPTNAIQVVGSTLRAGDSITASVVRSGTSYTLKVTDSSRSADSFSTTQTCSSCANSSAEWIAEAPSGSSGVYPLSDFGSWTESGATVKAGSTSGVISSFTDDELTMINSSGATKAQPGALNSSGNGFGVTWERSS